MFKKICEFLFGKPVTEKPAVEEAAPAVEPAVMAPAKTPAKAKKPRKAAPKKKSK